MPPHIRLPLTPLHRPISTSTRVYNAQRPGTGGMGTTTGGKSSDRSIYIIGSVALALGATFATLMTQPQRTVSAPDKADPSQVHARGSGRQQK